jgi:hypothetical protein
LVTFTAPVAWQEIAGQRQPVQVAYRLQGTNCYGFTLGKHNATQPVVIDPLLQATYLGGSDSDYVTAIAVSSNAVYVAGETYSSNFPGSSGGAQSSFGGGNRDGFVAKLNLELTALAQASYLGGSDWDLASAIAVSSNAVYVAGGTYSTNFPGSSGGAQSSHAGNWDSFVAKLNLELTALTQASYLGGSSSDDYASALAVSSSAVYVAGHTRSTNFPGASGAAQSSFGGGYNDSFVAKLNLELTALAQASYLGGSDWDLANAIAVSSNAVYVTGETYSSNFPGSSGGAQISNAGSYDSFVAKLNLELTALAQASYLGGSSHDYAQAIAVSSNAVYVAGYTYSSNFPGSSGGAQSSCNYCDPYDYIGDAFVAKLNLELTALQQASYLGGSNSDGASDLAVTSNAVYVAVSTGSYDFPGSSGGAQSSFGGGSWDGFVAKLNLELTALQQASYLGGSDWDHASALAVSSNAVYVAGGTSSGNFPGSSDGAQSSFGGSYSDGFVARFTPDLRAISPPSAVTNPPSVITPNSAKLHGTVNGNGAATTVSFDFGTTTSYGTNIAATPSSIAATAGATTVSADKTGLTCNKLYNYRVKAVNSVGTNYGLNQSFTTAACAPDFVVTSAVLTPAAPLANGTFTATVTVKNQGTAIADGGQLRLFSNQLTAPACAATGGDKNVAVGTLAVGASKTFTISGLNAGVGGLKTLRAFVDAACTTTETNETNNQRILNYRVAGRLPDLIVTSIALTPAVPAVNGTFSAAITVKNQGTTVSGTSYLDVWVNQATAQTCGASGTTWADVGTIAAGASKTLTVTGLSAGAAGTKTLRAFVDSWCETVESNETNNQLTKSYTVQ